MAGLLGLARRMRADRAGRHGNGFQQGLDHLGRGRVVLDQLGDQAETDLAAAGELDIDLGEQLRVEQSAMLDALRAVDAETRAA